MLSGLIAEYHTRTQGCRFAPTTGLKLANAFGVDESRVRALSLTHSLSLFEFGVNSRISMSLYAQPRRRTVFEVELVQFIDCLQRPLLDER